MKIGLSWKDIETKKGDPFLGLFGLGIKGNFCISYIFHCIEICISKSERKGMKGKAVCGQIVSALSIDLDWLK